MKKKKNHTLTCREKKKTESFHLHFVCSYRFFIGRVTCFSVLALSRVSVDLIYDYLQISLLLPFLWKTLSCGLLCPLY